MNKLGEQLDAAKSELDVLLAEIRDIALTIPNIPHDDAPVGRDENDNVEVSRWERRANSISKSAITSHWAKCTAVWTLLPPLS